MKKCALMLAALMLVGLCSCDESKKLASKLEGSWTGAPERLTDNAFGATTTIDTYTFTPDAAIKNGGQVLISTMLSVNGGIDQSQGVMQPFSLSAAASASVNGTWQAVDDDEVNLNIDVTTLSVEIDPKAVVLTMNMLNTDTSAATDSIKPQVMEHIKNRITQDLQNKYFALKRIDDVKIKGDVLEFEISSHDYYLTRQGAL